MSSDFVTEQAKSRNAHEIVVGNRALTIEEVNDIGRREASVTLCRDPSYVSQITSGAQYLKKLIDEDGSIYGVTTGYGDSVTVNINPKLLDDLPLQLTRFHGCGLGDHFDADTVRRVMVARLNSLGRGLSGVRYELLERLTDLINLGAVPLMPEEGSVGASGDLTPLSYLAAMLVGERDVLHKGAQISALDMHRELGLQPLRLQPKEGLALMNGTAVMTAIACAAYERAEYLTRLCARLTSLSVIAMHGNPDHFSEALFQAKPFAGQAQIAQWIRVDLEENIEIHQDRRLQDRYSLRCAPHVIGVLRDSLPWMRQFIETELNSSNDNPLVDPDAEKIYHGGHFYGGHIAFAMDSMKNCVANLADLMDRQMALLVDPKFNNGLPANLSGAHGDMTSVSHGFKAVQIGMSAWTAEALKLTMPASVFSRSTESHNQDKVSMGTISARDCMRVLQLTDQVAAAYLLATHQAIELRKRESGALFSAGSHLHKFHEDVSRQFDFISEDRPLESDLRRFVARIQRQEIELYSGDD